MLQSLSFAFVIATPTWLNIIKTWHKLIDNNAQMGLMEVVWKCKFVPVTSVGIGWYLCNSVEQIENKYFS